MTGNGKFIPIKMVTLGVVYCLTNINDKVPEDFGFLLDSLKPPIKICPTSCLSLIFICRSHLSCDNEEPCLWYVMGCFQKRHTIYPYLSTSDFRTKSICHWSTSSHMFVHPEPYIYTYVPILHISIASITPSYIYNNYT